MYGKLKGHLIRSMIIGKMATKNYGYIVSVNIRKMKDVLLHTENGSITIDHNFASIQIQGSFGVMEFLAGTRESARLIAFDIIREKLHHTDVASFIELSINHKDFEVSPKNIKTEFLSGLNNKEIKTINENTKTLNK